MMRKKARCRARHLRHAQTWDGITDDEILERDGWRCQIPGCKRRPIRKDASFPHPRSKSIDHIVPLSLGGDDTAANKRAAHLGCNVTRGNRMDFEQVALFGVIREPPLLTTTASGATTKLRPRKPCECGNEKPPGRPRCGACQEHQEAVAELRHQAVRERQHEAEERRRKKAADLAELIAQIDELRSRGLQSRTVAAKLGTSHRMVIRVGLRDPLTGKLPR